ncbi:hypothetical protein VSDG_07212 [Cytospora chrysosperma]|uniref:Microsomal glutathione S-transferase 3 n=1 Tax=Cytospora chrysosperma TaxID=252740 RepID=A0A423VKN0_CYTCH|nr:hypothetical protein VSDG_07212 [Valsa sordida]
MVLLDISNDYGYVLLVAASTTFVNGWHGHRTSKARKASGIGYPTAYASTEEAKEGTPAYLFNCAQRAHANFSENVTPFMANMLIAGLRYPLLAAGLGLGWLAGRVVYTVGYTTSGPKGRIAGALVHNLSLLGLFVTAGLTAFKMIQGQ